jgi:hypothetical protein
MTHNQRARLIKYVFWLVLLGGLGYAAWNISLPSGKLKKEVVKEKPVVPVQLKGKGKADFRIANGQARKKLAEILKTLVSPDLGIAVVHCHLPGDAESDQLVEVFNRIQKKYGQVIAVTRVEFASQPEDEPGQPPLKLPLVKMIVGKEQVFQFQGFWNQAKVEHQIDLILFGLKGVKKDWRPTGPGMTPAGVHRTP